MAVAAVKGTLEAVEPGKGMASGMAAALSTLTRWIAAVGTFAIGRKQSSIQVVESTLVRDASWYSDC